MKESEVRYRLVSALLQAEGPLTRGELLADVNLSAKQAWPVLATLIDGGLVVEGEFIPDKPAPQYGWAARWARDTHREAARIRQELEARVGGPGPRDDGAPAIGSAPALAFCDYIFSEYAPPPDKRFLVFLQCSVRRPFSKSPSHGSMRRAISVATGFDPARQFENCPVHVVVLASKLGPVPYELEDVYPANVGEGGVKHFGPEHYARVKPILAERMARYITVHGGRYEQAATFTEGRYGEVMAEAAGLAGVELPVLPVPGGPRVIRMGKSRPRTYWAKFWIQLYLEIVGWLDAPQREQAEARLRDLDVHYELGDA